MKAEGRRRSRAGIPTFPTPIGAAAQAHVKHHGNIRKLGSRSRTRNEIDALYLIVDLSELAGPDVDGGGGGRAGAEHLAAHVVGLADVEGVPLAHDLGADGRN